MSAPVSAMKTSAMVVLNPGMLVRSSRARRKGCIAALLQPLHLPGAFTGDDGPRPGQVLQFTDRWRGHEGGPHQPVGAQIGQPGSVGNIGFAARDVSGVTGVDQDYVQPVVFEEVVEGTPVVAGCFHHDQCHVLVEEVLLQIQDLSGHRGPCRDGGRRGPGAAALDADADLGVLLRNIDARAARVNDFHGGSPSETVSAGARVSVFRGGRINNKSDIRARGNNPRSRGQKAVPSTTKLGHRLTGTIDVSGTTETHSPVCSHTEEQHQMADRLRCPGRIFSTPTAEQSPSETRPETVTREARIGLGVGWKLDERNTS